MKLKLICCEVLYREMCAMVARTPHQVDVEFLPKGLHDIGAEGMLRRLQEVVDSADPERYDAVLMGYALCGNGIAGLEARRLPLVAFRAHDCIAILMGSRQAYDQYIQENSGVYFRSTGWLERGKNLEQSMLRTSKKKSGAGFSLEELIAQYGEDNGRYLWEQFNQYQNNYHKLAYIETGLESDGSFEEQARREAVEKNWEFQKLQGSLRLFEKMIFGRWDDGDFLVVPPGGRIEPTYDESIIRIAGAAS